MSFNSFECLLGERAAAVARVRAEQQGLSSRLERSGTSRLRTARAEREVLARALEKQVRPRLSYTSLSSLLISHLVITFTYHTFVYFFSICSSIFSLFSFFSLTKRHIFSFKLHFLGHAIF
jgi:hypothetical protein